MLGLVINHAQFVCTRTNDPLMTSVVGQLKNILSTIAGAILFSDFVFDIRNVIGLALSMIGKMSKSTSSAGHSELTKKGNLSYLPGSYHELFCERTVYSSNFRANLESTYRVEETSVASQAE